MKLNLRTVLIGSHTQNERFWIIHEMTIVELSRSLILERFSSNHTPTERQREGGLWEARQSSCLYTSYVKWEPWKTISGRKYSL